MNRKHVFILVVAVLISIILEDSSFALMDLAKITVRVVDESGKPVENVKVGIGFGKGDVYGITNSEGRFSGTASSDGHIGFNVTKPGYYMSIGKYDYIYDNKGILRWEPWNQEVMVVLRKIENPVPMYARDTNESRIEIPVTGKKVGFDLIEFDWVKPYGRGKISDMVCNLYIRRGGQTDYEYKVNITFPGQFNGIQNLEENLEQGSEYKLPRFAPEDGYKKELTVFIDRKPAQVIKKSNKDNTNYMFRIRSELEKGKFKKAMYGKIVGDIQIGTKKEGNAYLEFKYYLNPDYTRNLEFDPTQNLFLNLPEREQVRIK